MEAFLRTTKLSLSFLGNSFFNFSGSWFSKSLTTSNSRKTKNPSWKEISGSLKFNGALYELEDHDMKITLNEAGVINFISLKGITTNGAIRVPIKVKLDSNVKAFNQVRASSRMSKLDQNRNNPLSTDRSGNETNRVGRLLIEAFECS